jgi:hypothetical protein
MDAKCGRYWNFKWFCTAENSNKFQNTKFWKENLVEDVVTFGPTVEATLVVYNVNKIFWNVCVSNIERVHNGGRFNKFNLYA